MESLLTSPVGDVDSPQRRLHKRRARLSAARKSHFCGSVITHYDTFIPAACKGFSEGERLHRVRFGQIAAYVRTGEVGTHVRSKTAKFSYIWVVI